MWGYACRRPSCYTNTFKLFALILQYHCLKLELLDLSTGVSLVQLSAVSCPSDTS